MIPTAVIAFAGTQHRMEWEAVPRAGYPIHPISVVGLQRSISWKNIKFPFVLLKGLWQSWQLIDDFDADVAVGTGGFVSGPVLLAAHWRGRPILVQEQNAYAGLTNRLLGRWADRVHGAFEAAGKYFRTDDFLLTGNPTRGELLGVDRAEGRKYFDIPEEARVLFIFGGSGGSLALNRVVARFAEDLLRDDRVYVLWQTGRKYFQTMEQEVSDHERLQLMAYVDQMGEAYAAADLVVCRAGAITCSELMVTGTPALLVPSPNVVADHQVINARAMTERGAAELLEEVQLEETFTTRVRELLDDSERRAGMAEAARAMGRPRAAEEIARDVLRLAGCSFDGVTPVERSARNSRSTATRTEEVL
jgi:UDP-N-acetylglucosamine--N-acetylmuramyl-(pentapeptide) pyrophosphoryl-undecaprenol N-acetylglucosamine transferase